MKATTEYARTKLGRRFVSYEQISDWYNINYSEKAKESLENTFPSKEVIDHLCSEHFLLVAGPCKPICCYTIIGMMAQNGNKFQFEFEPFLQHEQLDSKWIAVKDSPSNAHYDVGNLEKQKEQLKKWGNKFPTLSETLWSFCLSAKANKGKIRSLKPFRTSTIGMFGRNVVICTRNDEIIISSGYDEEREDLCLLEAIPF